MRWLMDYYCYCVCWTLSWLVGSSEVCTDTLTKEKTMHVEWYLCFRCRADMVGNQTVIDVPQEPFDAVLARNEHVAESLVERRHGMRPNEWVRAKPCETRSEERLAVHRNDAVSNRIDEFEKFMRLERVARAQREV